MQFTEFPKMARWSRDVVVTEKLDGTNASICIFEFTGDTPAGTLAVTFNDVVRGGELCRDSYAMVAGSRTRWICRTDDNFGFANWAGDNANELFKLGTGHHFGEWWGRGIQRGYSKADRTFSLFNTHRWSDPLVRPACCDVVPVLYQGPNDPGLAERKIRDLKSNGSFAAPGFMNPEGIVLFHTAAGIGFKKTIEKDESPKSTWVKPEAVAA